MEKIEFNDKLSLSGNEKDPNSSSKQEIGGLVGNYKINNTTLTIKPNVGKIDVKLFVGQIPKNINEEYITNFFSKFGEILEVQIIRDPKTQSHKGCAFVKFQSLTQADEAIKRCSEIMLPGSNAYLQLRWADGEADRLGLAGIDEKHQTKLFVGSIPKNANEDNLKDIFNVYGIIEELHLMKDSDGSSKCCAFIKYVNKESALLAIRALNAQAYMLDSNKPIEVRFAEKKKISGYPGQIDYMQKPLNFLIQPSFMKMQSPQLRSTQQIIYYEYWTQEGKQAYFNPLTGQTQYERPTGVTILPYAMYQQSPSFYGGQPAYNQMQQQYLPATNTVLNINDISGNANANANTKKSGPSGSNLFIFHLPNDWKESDLYSFFMPFGEIISTRIMTDKQTGKSKGFGFISYNSPEAAQKAITQMNGFNIQGTNKRLKVEIKKRDDDDDSESGVPSLSNERRYSPFS